MKPTASLCIFCILALLSCGKADDHEACHDKILQLLQQERKAHFERNADLFVAEFADSMISVNKGKVSIDSREENKAAIAKYFANSTFLKWDDTAEPIIRIADDGSMAYAVVQKEVILNRKDDAGNMVKDTTYFAWTSIYRKQDNGEWKIECNISTNQ